MNNHISKKTLSISEVINICREFSSEVYNTNKKEYARRNQTNEEQIKSQISLGKMAEFFVDLFQSKDVLDDEVVIQVGNKVGKIKVLAL